MREGSAQKFGFVKELIIMAAYYSCEKVNETSWLSDLFMIKRGYIWRQSKRMPCSRLRMWKEYYLAKEGTQNGKGFFSLAGPLWALSTVTRDFLLLIHTCTLRFTCILFLILYSGSSFCWLYADTWRNITRRLLYVSVHLWGSSTTPLHKS